MTIGISSWKIGINLKKFFIEVAETYNKNLIVLSFYDRREKNE